MKPYRLNARSDEQGAPQARLEWDLAVPFAALWLTSLVRVAWVLMSRHAFGAQDTLAAVALFALPVLLARGAAAQ